MENRNKTKTIRELGKVGITDLRDKVLAIPDTVWKTQNNKKPNKFSVLERTEHIVFRFVNSAQSHRLSHDRELWQEWKGVILPVLNEITTAYGYHKAQFPRIMLAKLPAGTQIKRHIDAAPAARFPHKIHVPLLTNQDCVFFVERPSSPVQKMHMKVGFGYEVNNNVYHWAENNGSSDRIHLIFEYFPEGV
jgi:hypothetical protein